MNVIRRLRWRRIRGREASICPPDRLLGDVAEDWLASKATLSGSTLALYRSVLRTHILPLFAARHIGTIKRDHVRAAVDEWRLSLQPASVRRVLWVLRSVLDHALEPSTAVRNPCVGIRVPVRSQRRVVNP